MGFQENFVPGHPTQIAPLLTDALVTGLLITLAAHLILPGRDSGTDTGQVH